MSATTGFDGDEVKLILASLQMMIRLTAQDIKVSDSEMEKIVRVAESIRVKFQRAVLGSGLEIILPDEFIPPTDLNG